MTADLLTFRLDRTSGKDGWQKDTVDGETPALRHWPDFDSPTISRAGMWFIFHPPAMRAAARPHRFIVTGRLHARMASREMRRTRKPGGTAVCRMPAISGRLELAAIIEQADGDRRRTDGLGD